MCPLFTRWVRARRIVSEPTINSQCTHWVYCPSPPVSSRVPAISLMASTASVPTPVPAPAPAIPSSCHRAIFHAHFSPVFSTLSPTHSFTSFTIPLFSSLSTLLSRYRLAIRLTTLTNSYDLMTIPFILFLFFFHTLSFDEMRT